MLLALIHLEKYKVQYQEFDEERELAKADEESTNEANITCPTSSTLYSCPKDND